MAENLNRFSKIQEGMCDSNAVFILGMYEKRERAHRVPRSVKNQLNQVLVSRPSFLTLVTAQRDHTTLIFIFFR